MLYAFGKIYNKFENNVMNKVDDVDPVNFQH